MTTKRTRTTTIFKPFASAYTVAAAYAAAGKGGLPPQGFPAAVLFLSVCLRAAERRAPVGGKEKAPSEASASEGAPVFPCGKAPPAEGHRARTFTSPHKISE